MTDCWDGWHGEVSSSDYSTEKYFHNHNSEEDDLVDGVFHKAKSSTVQEFGEDLYTAIQEEISDQQN